MSIVVVAGDCSTTTSLLLAATWPEMSEAVVVEANPRGGSLGAWLNVAPVPSLTTAVTSIVPRQRSDSDSGLPSPTDGWNCVERFVQDSPSGVRVLVSPVRSLEATRAVMEAETVLFPLLAGVDLPVAVIDAGDPILSHARPAALAHADVVVMVHRQSSHSARGAAVRIERLAEQIETLTRFGVEVWVLVIGNDPFDPAEIGTFVDPTRRSTLVVLPEDHQSAAVLAGRAGVSAKRFARMPLVRAGREIATLLEAAISSTRFAISGGEVG
jgi:MinD-like ATPase involved in chromosome partitioning or flagellar assembly